MLIKAALRLFARLLLLIRILIMLFAKSFLIILFADSVWTEPANLYIDNITPTANNRRSVTDELDAPKLPGWPVLRDYQPIRLAQRMILRTGRRAQAPTERRCYIITFQPDIGDPTCHRFIVGNAGPVQARPRAAGNAPAFSAFGIRPEAGPYLQSVTVPVRIVQSVRQFRRERRCNSRVSR